MFYSKIVWDWTGDVVEREVLEYAGPIESCKGSGVAQQQMNRDNAIQDAAIQRQNAQLDKINSAFSSYLSGNQGYDPQALALMKAQFLNQNSQGFNDASTGLRAALASRGIGTGDSPVGGEFTRGLTGLYSAGAANRSSGLANIDLSNLQQMLTNKFNAGSLMSGNAAMLNNTIGVAGQGASSALNSYIQAKNSGFMQSFMGGLGGGLAAGLTGGIGTALGNKWGVFSPAGQK